MMIGVENQSYVDFHMPLWVMLYDTLDYYREYEACKDQIRRKDNRKEKNHSFFDQRLHAVIAFVLYYGERAWSGPRSLREMVGSLPPRLEASFQDYHINIIEVRDCDCASFHHPRVRFVMDMCRILLSGEWEELQKRYGKQYIKTELAKTIAAWIGASELREYLHEKESEMTDMCTALEELLRKGEQRGGNRKDEKKVCAM